MTIWGLPPNSGLDKIEKVDTCTKADAAYLCGEYRMAFRNWTIWAGRKCDCPIQNQQPSRY